MEWWIACLPLAGLIWMLFFARREHFPYRAPEPRADETRASGMRTTVILPATDETKIEGWLYLPHIENPPIILMAPGLTGFKEGHLENFAWRFAQAGFATLLIDLRSFGGSGGWPRHWLDPLMQIDDYRSAIAHIRTSLADRVDVSRIMLWGSSFSGAAAISAAAQEPQIAGVVAQVPYLGGLPAHPPGRMQIAGYIALSIAEMCGDALAGLFGLRLNPAYVTTYGKPGEHAFAMSTDNPPRYAASTQLHPFWATMPQNPRGGWKNRMLVRGLQNLGKTSPQTDIKNLACPILLIGAMKDDMVRFEYVREAAMQLRAGGSRFVQYDCGHYDPYVAPLFETNISTQVDFLQSMTRTSQPF